MMKVMVKMVVLVNFSSMRGWVDDEDYGNKNATNLHIWQRKTIVLHALHVHSLFFYISKPATSCLQLWNFPFWKKFAFHWDKSSTNPTSCQGLQNCSLSGRERSPLPSTFATVFRETDSLLSTCRVWLLDLAKGCKNLEFSASLSFGKRD